MDARSKIRRMALVCAGALAIVPLTAVPASAQSPEDLAVVCDELPDNPICEAIVGDDDDEAEENGDGGPAPDELCALQDEAPEELAPILDGLGVVLDELCPPEEEPDEEEPEPEPEPLPEEDDETEDTTDADPSGALPVTGGAAGLLGLGMLGAGVALRRLRREGVDLG